MKKVFGVQLEDVELYEGVPKPVYDTLCYFHHHPDLLETEGLFRVSGSLTNILEIKKLYNEGQQVDLEKYDVHTVSATFKAFFRELPESLVTAENTDLFLVFIELDQKFNQDKNKTITKLQNVLNELPLVYLNVLKTLIQFLVLVEQKKDINKMDSKNLSLSL
ncbi:hypothetical protein EIN_097200 [Entamoeba invadens IP1]|uniref:Rho-GAP domain-containing protein n=1 Tax=Entamoeba invadens IP1 TaxID=370355 RepID=A0A0A1U426_ENTIV|nr:hypothetical protein EIN_097200 [Entamoeba invadens IP1]ELP87453.1 hypothetical protein EIN_097200 [Entamoeba invadens IP1]|eukprot:XP_004254224.1 hypothetical protein EIN_097200 [Entamoeba invadens IP1]